jgi:transketolase
MKFKKKNLIDAKKKILEISYLAKEGHIASSYSVLDILNVLVKNFLFKKKKYLNNFILSKGHASIGYYVILNKYGYISNNKLLSFCKFNSCLGGHPSLNVKNYISASTGSLGHGLPIAAGMAYSSKQKNYYTIIGDQECNEGAVWETLLLSSHHKLKNLTVIIDRNFSREDSLKLYNLKKKFLAFTHDVYEINGHCYQSIYETLKQKNNNFKIIIANTIKGNGIDLMENNNEWHHKFPKDKKELAKLINMIKF